MDKNSVVSVRHIPLFAMIIKCFLFVFRIFCSHYPSEYIVIAFLCCSKDPAPPRESDTERRAGVGGPVPLLCKVSIQLFGKLFGGYTANEGQRESANAIKQFKIKSSPAGSSLTYGQAERQRERRGNERNLIKQGFRGSPGVVSL